MSEVEKKKCACDGEAMCVIHWGESVGLTKDQALNAVFGDFCAPGDDDSDEEEGV